ncbi:MAG TPA: hypothetical protein VFF15_04625 [Flavobacteriaceae bacterium]|nr:hypothetical protein [Flavobacteriaceae bacterium]
MILQHKRITASILFVLISVASIAQGSGPPPPAPPPPPGLPVDGGVIFLALAGLIFGVVVLLKKNKSTTSS